MFHDVPQYTDGLFQPNWSTLLLEARKLLQEILPVPSDQTGQVLKLRRLLEVRKELAVRRASLDPMHWRSCALDKAWGVVAPESLDPLLVVQLVVPSDIDEVEDLTDD